MTPKRIKVKPANAAKPASKKDADAKSLENISSWSEDTAVRRFTKDELSRLAENVLGLSANTKNKRSMVKAIKAALGEEPTAPAAHEVSSHQFGIRCTHCNNIVVEMEKGFDPTNSGIPFWRWPAQFKGPGYMTEEDLSAWRREEPRCTFCNWELPMRADYTQVLPRAIVRID